MRGSRRGRGGSRQAGARVFALAMLLTPSLTQPHSGWALRFCHPVLTQSRSSALCMDGQTDGLSADKVRNQAQMS